MMLDSGCGIDLCRQCNQFITFAFRLFLPKCLFFGALCLCIFKFILSPMVLYLDSTFELVIQIAMWLIISKNATLKCSRPDSKGAVGAGRYLMLPRATESAEFGG